jgi:hypothetical protein
VAGVRALIEEGANVNEADNDGRTPLYMAASNAPPGIFGATPAANSSGSVRVSMPFSGGFGGGGAFWGGNSPGAFGKPAGSFGAAPASPFGAPAACPPAF